MKLRIAVLLLIVFVAPLTFAEDTVDLSEGILIIDLQARFSSEVGVGHARGAWLKNMKTGKTYGSARNTLQLIVLPEGVYCIDEIELFPRGMGVASFCAEPYINVVRGRLNNAGQWKFVVNLGDGTVALENSLLNPDQTLQDIKKKYPDYF